MSENVDDAIINAANAESDASKAAADKAKAETAKHTADAALAATAAAESAAALANAKAAETINENKDDVTWLKQHAEQTENSLKELMTRHQSLTEALPAMFEKHQQNIVQSMLEALTPLPSINNETPGVNPENEEEDGLKDNPSKIKPKAQKRRASWI